MSTKITLYFDEKIHFFQECFDENNVYLTQDDKSCSVSQTLRLDQIVGIVKSINIESLKKQAALTDEQILDFVQKTVSARKNSSNTISHMFGALVYGDAGDSIDEQVARGFKHYAAKRDTLRKVCEALTQRKGSNFYFGLEELL
jgi:hypothetical protein